MSIHNYHGIQYNFIIFVIKIITKVFDFHLLFVLLRFICASRMRFINNVKAFKTVL